MSGSEIYCLVGPVLIQGSCFARKISKLASKRSSENIFLSAFCSDAK